MTQTSSINAFDTKKLDAMESELKQLNNLTPSEIIARMNQLYEKYSSEYQSDKEKMSSELRVKYEELLAAMKRDVVEMEWKMNSSEKIDVRMQTLDALRNFQSVATTTAAAQSAEKPTESIAVEKDTPKPLEVAPIDTETSEFLKNFQTEAAEAFKKEVLGENGKPNYLSFRKGLEFVAGLQDLENVNLEEFDWLDKTEREKLVPQMTVVRGILGAIFVEALFSVGYTIAFNGDGTVNMRAKSGITDVNEKMNEINTAIKRNPGLSETLKMGLLYADGDLLKYMQSVATSDGNNITPDLQKPEEFIKYLHNRDKSQSTVAGDAIKNSADFFKGINLSAQMKAANHIPEIWSALSVAMKDPNTMVNLERTVTEVNRSVDNINNQSMSRGEALMSPKYQWNWRNESWGESIDKHWYIGGWLTQIGYSWMRGMSSIMSTPTSATVAVIGLIFSLFKFGFKDTLMWLGLLPTAIGAFGSAFDGTNSKNSPTESASTVPFTPPQASDAEKHDTYKQINGNDASAQEAKALMDNFSSASNVEMQKYIDGDKNANLTDDQKKILDDPKNAEMAQKNLEGVRNRAIEKATQYANELNLPSDARKEMFDAIDLMTYEELLNWVSLGEQAQREFVRKYAQRMKEEADRAGDKEASWFWNWVQNNYGTIWIWLISTIILAYHIGGKREARKIAQNWIRGGIIGWLMKGTGKLWNWARWKNTPNNTPDSPSPTPDSPNDTPNPIPDKTGKWLAQYEQEVNDALLEEDRLAKKTRWIVFAGKESKQHAENAAKLQEERNKIEKFNSNRPFANEAARKDMNTKYDTLTEQIADTNRKISRLSNPTLDEYLELSNPEETLVSLNNKLANLNNQLANLNASMSPKMSILLNGDSYNITALQAREFESALKTLREFDGRTIYEYTSTGTQVSKISADEMKRLNDALTDVNNIRSEVAASRNLTYTPVNITNLLEDIAAKRGTNRIARFAINGIF